MRLPLLISVCVGLSACSTAPLDAPMSETFGLAVASMESQIIASTASDLPPDSSAARAAAAVERYAKGQVKQPPTQSTSNVAVNISSVGGK